MQNNQDNYINQSSPFVELCLFTTLKQLVPLDLIGYY
jgi:hypothetical protein